MKPVLTAVQAPIENLLAMEHKQQSASHFYQRNYTCNSVVIVFEYARVCYISYSLQDFNKSNPQLLEIIHWQGEHVFDAFFLYKVLHEVKKSGLNHDDKKF
jgi:hypothetical protein